MCAHPSRYWRLCSPLYVDPPKGYPHDVYNIYPSSSTLESLAAPEMRQSETQECVVVRLSPTYPSVMPCEPIKPCSSFSEVHGPPTDEPVYPWNLQSIYPAAKADDNQQIRELPVSLPGSGYPNIEPCKYTDENGTMRSIDTTQTLLCTPST